MVVSICVIFLLTSVIYCIYGFIQTQKHLNAEMKEPNTSNEIEEKYIEKYNLSMQENAKYMGICMWSTNYLMQTSMVSAIGGVALGIICTLVEKYKGEHKNKSEYRSFIVQICIVFTILSVILNFVLLCIVHSKIGKEVEPENYVTEIVRIKEGDLISRVYMRYLLNAEIRTMDLCGTILIISIVIGIVTNLIESKKEK